VAVRFFSGVPHSHLLGVCHPDFLTDLMSGKKHLSADDVRLIPAGDFVKAVKKALSVTKTESDKQLAKVQASNLKKREAKKRR
jgi:hypothetical protein